MDFFHQNGCRLSDHAVDEMSDEMIEKLIYLGQEYAKAWLGVAAAYRGYAKQ